MKGVRRFLLLFLSLTLFIMPLCVCVCVVRVHADTNNTYVVFDDGCYNTSSSYIEVQGSSDEVRVVSIVPNGSYNLGNIFLVSAEPFGANGDLFTSACSAIVNSAGLNYGYYVSVMNYGGNNVNYQNKRKEWIQTYNVPVINDTPTIERAIYYTFGEGAISPDDPVDPIVYGSVSLQGYQTMVRGQGEASVNNIDVISWDPVIDTLGNDITNGYVRIRLIPGEYTGETKNGIIQKLYSDFILDVVHATDGNRFRVPEGSASFKWSDVINTLQLPFMSWATILNTNDGWLKRGWMYEIRLEIDDYIGEWQPIYSSTSSGVENDLEIVNTTTITQNTINAINEVNTINETTNIWIIYETPVDPNPEYQPPEDDDEKPWWVYLLEMINNSIGVTNQYISEGTDESVQVVNNINNDNDTLNQTVNDYDDIEDDLITDFNDNTENIDLDDTLIGNNGFLNAARWISQQFTTITTDNPFGAILKFSLVLGFVLIFLGRFR